MFRAVLGYRGRQIRPERSTARWARGGTATGAAAFASG